MASRVTKGDSCGQVQALVPSSARVWLSPLYSLAFPVDTWGTDSWGLLPADEVLPTTRSGECSADQRRQNRLVKKAPIRYDTPTTQVRKKPQPKALLTQSSSLESVNTSARMPPTTTPTTMGTTRRPMTL